MLWELYCKAKFILQLFYLGTVVGHIYHCSDVYFVLCEAIYSTTDWTMRNEEALAVNWLWFKEGSL